MIHQQRQTHRHADGQHGPDDDIDGAGDMAEVVGGAAGRDGLGDGPDEGDGGDGQGEPEQPEAQGAGGGGARADALGGGPPDVEDEDDARDEEGEVAGEGEEEGCWAVVDGRRVMRWGGEVGLLVLEWRGRALWWRRWHVVSSSGL